MVFRRRKKQPLWKRGQELVYPSGGWRRAGIYLWHRTGRLSDPPHRIARGIWVGVFVSFSPLFGLHLIATVALSAALRANIFAALLATLITNPITLPFIGLFSVELGYLLLEGGSKSHSAGDILPTAMQTGAELWRNLLALLWGEEPHWPQLRLFYDTLLKPYLLGGAILGFFAASLAYGLSLSAVRSYQLMRQKRRQKTALAAAKPAQNE